MVKFFYKVVENGYAIRRQEPNHSTGYVHIKLVASLDAAKDEVKLLNEMVQKKGSHNNPDQTDATNSVYGESA